MKEEWGDIFGFVGLYQVSTLGRVRRIAPSRLAKTLPYVMKTAVALNGYEIIRLHKDGKYTNKYVHRLVAECFLPRMGDCEEVNHIDGVKLNNTVDNLEWSNRSLNNKHKTRVLKSYHGKRDYIVTSPDGESYEVSNLSEFCEMHGILQSGLANVLTGKRSHHHGYTAKYKGT